MTHDQDKWYAVHTRSHFEQKVFDGLRGKSIETFLPKIKTVGVVRMIGFEGKPTPAREEEIQSLMIMDGTDRTVHNRSIMKRGDRVMIMEGPLKGLVGFYVCHKGQSEKVVVNIELLHRALAVEIEDWALEKVDF